MEKLKTLLALLPIAFITFTGCSDPTNGSGNEDPGNGNGGGSEVDVNRSIEVSDAEGTMIGYLVDTDLDYLTLLTEDGYILMISWNGTIQRNSLSFTETDLAGLCYFYEPMGDQTPVYSKRLYTDGTRLFLPSIEEGDTYPVFKSGDYTFQSRIDYEGTVTNGNWSFNSTYLHLEQTTDSDLVALLSISGPLTLSQSASE